MLFKLHSNLTNYYFNKKCWLRILKSKPIWPKDILPTQRFVDDTYAWEVLLKWKALYCWPPCTKCRSFPFYIEKIIYISNKISDLNEEVNCSEPSPSVSVPCMSEQINWLTCGWPWSIDAKECLSWLYVSLSLYKFCTFSVNETIL